MNKLIKEIAKDKLQSYITPLFWQHGEDEDILRNEIRQMSENGIGSFIVESRPHPDFLGDKWWRDIDIIVDEAKKRKMKVWMFDDGAYPSGFCGGKIRDKHPQYMKTYLAQRHIDAIGPLRGSSFIIKAWLKDNEILIGVVAAKRSDGEDGIISSSLINITDKINNGRLYWDVPEGNWRVFVLISTRDGGELWTKDYLNPLIPEAVECYINYVHEEHYRRYPEEFGNTIAGFFTDEPRFGNSPSYQCSLGKKFMEFPYGDVDGPSGNQQTVLPFCDNLIDLLNAEWGEDITTYLPLLWYQDNYEIYYRVRYTFMDTVSRLFGENFTGQLGRWCRNHGVKLIGHVVEDNGAHARLGYGSGHFFRSIKGLDASGLDIVYHVWPEYTSGRFASPFSFLDADFFYWGITKMATSAAHIDPKKNGTTVCEIFGAYGWQEGLKLMKWLTDHICVRGVNFIIPHAFSPKQNDTDCPPHFYARGENPQWRYFKIWSDYSNRICHMLSGGKHIAPAAVLYHAEAEWSGNYMPFEKVVKALAINQIDCDILPVDTIIDTGAITLCEGTFQINNERYGALIIPYSQRLPTELINRLVEFTGKNINIIFIDSYPENSSNRAENFSYTINELISSEYSTLSTLEAMPDKLKGLALFDISVCPASENLRYYHYINNEINIYFFTNESRSKTVNSCVTIAEDIEPVGYDPMKNIYFALDYEIIDGNTYLDLCLEPYESIFILSGNTDMELSNDLFKSKDILSEYVIEEVWNISVSEALAYPEFLPVKKISELVNMAIPGLLPEFSGTIRYECEINCDKFNTENKYYLDLGEVYEIAEVWINEKHAGTMICPPYRTNVTHLIINGTNKLRIDVTNTLAKKLGNNVFDRSMPQEPSGLLGPVKLLTIK